MEQTLQAEDKRQYQRIKFAEPVGYQFNRDQNRFGGFLSYDISSGGIRIHSRDFVSPDTELTLHLEIDKHDVIDCVARVIWCEKNRYSESYQCGLSFVDNDASISIRSKLQEFINQS